MAATVLLAGDVDAIKEFVFETSPLPQIRGGSELLLECEKNVRESLRKQYGFEVIYCSGGSFLLEVPSNKVDEVKQAIERLYLEATGAATVTVVSEDDRAGTVRSSLDGWAGRLVKAAEDALAAGDFSRRVWNLGSGMWGAKTQKSTAPFYEALPFGRRCDRCGKRMVSKEQRVGTDTERLCPICARRASRGRVREREIRGKFNADFWSEYGKEYVARQPRDLDDLTESAKRKYLAFLYADGNDIGRLLQKLKNPEQYSAVSDALVKGTQEAMFGALTAVCGAALKKDQCWPFDIVNIGGDDVTVLVQGSYAWELAVEFLEHFEQKVNKKVQNVLGGSWPEKITAACGIAIADMKYPIRYLEHLATDLLKEAKKVAKVEPDTPRSAATFMWLPTPVASEKAEPLMAYYRRPEAHLTARPYTLQQARHLMDSVNKVAGCWPRTLRHRWAEALEQGVMTSVNAIHYDIARRKEDQRRAFNETLVDLGRMSGTDGAPLEIPAPIWHQHRDGDKVVWRTALLDALELAELQAMRPDAEETEER